MATELLSSAHKFMECMRTERCISAFHSIASPGQYQLGLAFAYQQGMVPRYMQQLEHSQRFYIGDLNGVPQIKHHIKTDTLHLPYPLTTFEFDWQTEIPLLHPEEAYYKGGGVSSNFTSRKLICLCEDYKEPGESDDHISEKIENRMKITPLLLGKIDSTKLASFYSDDVGLKNTEVLSNQDLVLDDFLHFIIGISESDRIMLSAISDPTVTAQQRGQVHYQAIKPLYEIIGGAIISTLVFMSCSNVTNEVVRADPKINRKRIGNGKVPFLSYRVLKLQPRNEGRYKDYVRPETDPEDKRKSPAFHLRRGHYRRLSPDNAIWITPTTVGNIADGIRIKDYTVIFREND